MQVKGCYYKKNILNESAFKILFSNREGKNYILKKIVKDIPVVQIQLFT